MPSYGANFKSSPTTGELPIEEHVNTLEISLEENERLP
jgi:hypothetical protein